MIAELYVHDAKGTFLNWSPCSKITPSFPRLLRTPMLAYMCEASGSTKSFGSIVTLLNVSRDTWENKKAGGFGDISVIIAASAP